MISEEEEALAWRLRQYREWAGMKQSEAAKVLGLDATAITKIEHNERGVSAMELLALAKAYHVSVSTLLGEEMQPKIAHEHSNPPQSAGALIHQHQFDIAATDMTIVRWCPDCGKTWMIVRYASGGLFESTWKEVHEP